MKTMKCSEMGGSCEMELSANTWEEMAVAGMKHAEETHPEMAEAMKTQTPEVTAKWNEENKAKFDAMPEVVAPVEAPATEEHPAA